MIEDYFYGQLRQSKNILFLLQSTEEVISLTYGEICPVPGVSFALIGVVNQRGKLLWVLDLSDLFQIAPEPKTRRSQDTLTLLVLSNRNSEQQVGCVVSVLKGIISLDLALQSLSFNANSTNQCLEATSVAFEGNNYDVIDGQGVLNSIHNLTYPSNLVLNP